MYVYFFYFYDDSIQICEPHSLVVELILKFEIFYLNIKGQDLHIKKLLLDNDAKIIAHYYVDEQVQRLAEDTGGFVGDSLEMARYGSMQSESTLLVAGVRFMGETAKILNPDKKIIMIDMDATCSLDTGCDFDEFKKFCNENDDREVVVYANTSAKVKSISDWVVTSSIAVPLIENLTSLGKKLIGQNSA